MPERPPRIVTPSMIRLHQPALPVWAGRVPAVLRQEPGPVTRPGGNTHLIGTGRRPLLLDTGQGLPQYLPLLERGLRETQGGDTLQAIVLTHGHVDHIGGVAGVQERFGPLSVTKKPWDKLDGGLAVEPA